MKAGNSLVLRRRIIPSCCVNKILQFWHSGCGTVASETREPRFEYSNRPFLFTVRCQERANDFKTRKIFCLKNHLPLNNFHLKSSLLALTYILGGSDIPYERSFLCCFFLPFAISIPLLSNGDVIAVGKKRFSSRNDFKDLFYTLGDKLINYLLVFLPFFNSCLIIYVCSYLLGT